MTAMKEQKAKKTVDLSSDENVLAMYLREIGRIPLLSREEENKHAQAAAKGNIAARNKLVTSNLRFVINVAKKYQGQGLPLADLISEGNIGLMKAAERFDAGKGYHFISYAVWWIRQAILKAICEKSRLIRLPANRINELIQIEQARKLISGHQNAEDEIRELAALLNMDQNHIEDMINISREMTSLESPVNQGADSSLLGDFIEDEQYHTPEQNAVRSALADDIESLLETLDAKEAAIIRSRYGLGKNVPLSLQELGDRYNLTKERIRQIEQKAITRLQHPARIQRLATYVA